MPKPIRPHGERSTPAGEHVPVMLSEVLGAFQIRPGATVVDCTLGFAGHSRELLRATGPTGQLLAFDLDGQNLPRATEILSPLGSNFELIHGNFASIANALAARGLEGIDALLADLGMSSMQVDDASRGFSFMRSGPLDMRMDPSRGTTAAQLLQTIEEDELTQALTELGDEPQAEAIAAAIVREREKAAIETTDQLRELIQRAAPVRAIKSPGAGPARKQEMLPTTRVFQTVRILVNRELANLQQLLRVLPTILKPGGTAAIITFHSGEDRLVKAAFRDGQRQGI
ncbi:MAG: 16S rRNA (cytosine(1402)-N(4))-methyltransferase RsmH, partial [Gemmataceae bacterium]